VSGSGLKSLTATKIDLIGPGLHLAGYLGSLKIGDVGGGADIVVGGTPPATLRNPSVKITAGVIGAGSDVTVAAAPLGSLTAISVGDGTVTAPSVGTITARKKAKTKAAAAVPGDFNADVSVSRAGVEAAKPALKKLKAAGGVTDAVITVAGNLGNVSVAGRVSGTMVDVTGDVGAVSVGSFWNSRLDAGHTGTNTYALGRAGGFLIPLINAAWHITDGADYFLSGTFTATPSDGRADAWIGELLTAARTRLSFSL
jgi:hypothetical protein